MLLGRSWFSLQEGTTPVPALVERTARQGWRSLVLADRGAMYGMPAFMKACRQAGVKGIPGCTLPLAGGPVTFVATSTEGYRSLSRLVTEVGLALGLGSGSGSAPGPGLVAVVSRPEQAGALGGACPAYLALDYAAPLAVNQALAAAGLPLIAVVRGENPPTVEEFAGAFSWCPEAVAAARALETRCSADAWPAAGPRLPAVAGDLRDLARAGLAARYGAAAPYQQLEKELAVIYDRGQAGYFLALWDLVSFARREGIPVGPGRGSAVGSLTAYALGITAIDPVAHRLYFERFLNPERPDLPDIDIDVCSRGRGRLIAYLRDRHGPDRVAHAGVLATLGARGAVREAGRRLGTPRDVVDRVAGALPHHGTIDDAVARLPEFQYINTAQEPVRSLLLVARELEGRPWHPSVHAAGVVIAPEPLADLVPLELAAGGEVITQYTADELEALGLVKIDILGLRNLTVIAAASAEAGVAPESLPLDDADTFRLLASGETIGVFQLDSPGIRNLLRQVRPERMDDLIAVLSLYRPGPFEAGAVDLFTRRRRGMERVTHLHPALAPILDETYGVLLYQEQAMRIAHEVAGMSLADADLLRRSLGKGDASRYRERFLRGCDARGIPGGTAVQIFGLLERFCGYSFNKAHTAAYALVCYQTAYLKAHAPAQYFAALLAHESGYFGPGVYIGEAERLGVRLLPPHLNLSAATYATAGPGAIRTGLLQVRDVGPGAVHAILAAREAGPFLGVADFCARISPRHCRPRTVEALLEAGAFVGLAGAAEGRASRAAVLASVKAGRPLAVHRARGQLTLFDLGLPGAGAGAGSGAGRGAGLGAGLAAGLGAGLAAGLAAGLRAGPSVVPTPAPAPTRQPLPAGQAGGAPPPIIAISRHGSAISLTGPIITARRRPVPGSGIGLTLLLSVGSEQVEVLVPPAIYARDLLAIDPAGITVEGRIQRHDHRVSVVAGAIRPGVPGRSHGQ